MHHKCCNLHREVNWPLNCEDDGNPNRSRAGPPQNDRTGVIYPVTTGCVAPHPVTPVPGPRTVRQRQTVARQLPRPTPRCPRRAPVTRRRHRGRNRRHSDRPTIAPGLHRGRACRRRLPDRHRAAGPHVPCTAVVSSTSKPLNSTSCQASSSWFMPWTSTPTGRFSPPHRDMTERHTRRTRAGRTPAHGPEPSGPFTDRDGSP